MNTNLECPVCHSTEHYEDASFCQACGTELNNYCKNPQCFANREEEKVLNALSSSAKYCPYCGGETTFHDYL